MEEQVIQPSASIGATKHGDILIGGTEAEGTVIGGTEYTPFQNINNDSGSHPIENVLADLISGITTRSGLRNMCVFKAFLLEIEPKKITEALLDADWIIAMQEEFNQFGKRKVWHLVPHPKDRSVIETKWVYRNKVNEHGTVTRNKERLVVQGYNQEEGIDFNETFAPIARFEAIRLLVAFVVYIEFILYHMDVKSSFLNGILKKELYVKHPRFESKEFLDHV
ncbi:uncharacterized mitochondrial protein AtMg00820-like [Capsicum annuum]|uniref:uncharacterized mitochondrial protein AtMg00820-like n=1 Tax=Capsicum annuum TaxID=4072 RepID=UPI001FB0978B|nr:uncharacterized mitochondrial protein AtMg00820-like [Capsicum annuum]